MLGCQRRFPSPSQFALALQKASCLTGAGVRAGASLEGEPSTIPPLRCSWPEQTCNNSIIEIVQKVKYLPVSCLIKLCFSSVIEQPNFLGCRSAGRQPIAQAPAAQQIHRRGPPHVIPLVFGGLAFFVVLPAVPMCVHMHRECLSKLGFVEGQDVTCRRLSLTQDSLLNHEPLLFGR